MPVFPHVSYPWRNTLSPEPHPHQASGNPPEGLSWIPRDDDSFRYRVYVMAFGVRLTIPQLRLGEATNLKRVNKTVNHDSEKLRPSGS